MPQTKPTENREWLEQLIHEDTLCYYKRVRNDSEHLCEPLEIEDFGIQTMPEVSPPKWHLAHTSWFFETLILKIFNANYQEYNSEFSILFNSYYDTIGTYHPRGQRGLLSRPTVKEVYQYRAYVDKAMSELLLQATHPQQKEIISLTALGLNHEQQHQELLLTDIKHIFASNPLRPVYKRRKTKQKNTLQKSSTDTPSSIHWLEFKGGIQTVGHSDITQVGISFTYDNEGPRHKVYLENFMLASTPVSNGDYLEFINAGGYQQVDLWLSDAWKIVNNESWNAPLYWEKIDNQWFYMTLAGLEIMDKTAPVCHVSFFEAVAYARWLNLQQPGIRLPTETEWEVASNNLELNGNFRESDLLQPHSINKPTNKNSLNQMFGDVWEWTQSAYTAYPGYHAAIGPLGEYNGKFMSSQMVLRGGSCITPNDHIRKTYRNFFYPHERWQFSGIRLAKDVQ